MAELIFDPSAFRCTQVSSLQDKKAIRAATADHRLMLGAIMETIVRRFEQNRNYPFIDTKLSMYDGREFADDPLRGREVIYSWIQGRGLEALAGHLLWFKRCKTIFPEGITGLTLRLQQMLATVFDSMERLRGNNRGRLCFMMTTTGQPLKVGSEGQVEPHAISPDGPTTSSDIFYVKGMAAAAAYLGRTREFEKACEWFRSICRDVGQGRVVSDQQPLDPKNVATQNVPGRFGHGARMLSIGGTALFLELTGDPWFLDMGVRFIDEVLERFTNLSERPALGRQYDMWEFVDAAGRPWLDPAGRLFSDPGHSTEFVGLSLKLLRVAEGKGLIGRVPSDKLSFYRKVMPGILERNFLNGFSEHGFGICKTFDLVSRSAVNSDMPWWSLPETIRAAMEAARFCDGGPVCRAMGEIARKCSNAFLKNYVRPDLHLMAYQTLSADGKPVDVIPATPDADPGYHTGLSIIDALDVLDEIIKERRGCEATG